MRAAPAILAALAWAPALAQTSNDGELVHEAVECGGVTATLMVNHRTVAQPTLFMEDEPILLPDGPSYGGPVCVEWRGDAYVGFTEYMGNSYEVYRLVDLDTFEPFEITYEQSRKIDWWGEGD